MTPLRMLLLAAVGPALLGACSSGDTVLFQSSAERDSTTSGTSTTGGRPREGAFEGATGAEPTPNTIPCTHHGDCPSTWFCSKASCGATLGSCEPPPVFCDSEPDPVCGCGGITFWNDCVRRQNRASASSSGECQVTAVPCDTTEDCGVPSARCARLLFPGQSCPGPGVPPLLGTCWAVPSNCSDQENAESWALCPHPQFPPVAGCVDTCLAITSEWPHMIGTPACDPF